MKNKFWIKAICILLIGFGTTGTEPQSWQILVLFAAQILVIFA